MKTYSSSTVKLFTGNCPKALGFHEDGTPFDRDIFQPGIAAHACMQVIAEKNAREYADQEKVCEAVVEELIQKGRSYNDIPEPPMSPEHAFEGRDIALNYLMYNDLPEDIIIIEQGLGMDSNGNPCDYNDDKCRYRGILDLGYFETIGDEEFQARMLTVGDWKSAWPTDESELDTLQRKGQAVLAWQHHGMAVEGIKREVVNLRTGMPYSDDIYFDDEGIAKLEQWKKDILTTCKAADVTRTARPGAGCLTCWYRAGCDDCLSAYKGDGVDDATQYVALEALRSEIAKPLRAKAKVSPIKVHGGTVAYRSQNKKIPTDEAISKLLEHWFMDQPGEPVATESDLRGLLTALSLPASSFEKAAKVLYPEKGDASFEDMIAACVTTKAESRFGVTKS